MPHQFSKHYTRDEARALLPQVKEWLGQLEHLQAQLQKAELRVHGLMEHKQDAGGEVVNSWVRSIADVQETLGEFRKREILVKDLERGLIDFPAILGGREVFLCWEKGEDDIEFWHDLDAGYAGRERL